MNSEYLLENFYHGAENLETLVRLQKYIDNPAGDVVFLLGDPSSGKTHLLYGIAYKMRSSKDLKVKMLTSESLKNGLVTSIKDGTTAKFWADLQNIDMLLVDDCQFLIDSTIDILLELSTIYRETGKTLILAGDYLQDNVRTIPSLILLRLVRPAQATRKLILQERLRERDLFLEDALLDLISGIEDPRRIAGFVAWLSATQDCS